ncbi:hypothetical protein Lesp02_11140 [Lentzea sp. NBRC 105346]|uniref:hypothetical protein n=1 Tax=Lentzea sp. NBRC 105346 TaxID=3032205 RepID=UPI0024A54113|nr:hypothetical protein [Lentzea sp. NBRC 105346]GLZ28924.1 hypothetical protein Lesp02_11140 [Lentzea sp. NBRC 105346]
MSPRTLELRIHGVNNTPPHAMLGLPREAVGQTGGDHLGGFWTALEPGEELRTEAYSWGGMARNSMSLPVKYRFLDTAARIGWALLLPFGLANVAYWSRKLPIGKQRPDWHSGSGAATTRLFGLGLTVLLVLAACEIALDLAAIQSARMPDWFTGLPVATRVAIASAAPVLLLLGLWLLTARSRVRYEQKTTSAGRSDRGAVMLADPELWRGDTMLRELTRVHLAAGLSVVALVSSVDVWAFAPAFRVTSVLSFALLIAAAALASRRVADAPDVKSEPHGPRGSMVLLAASVTVLVEQIIALVVVQPSFTAPLMVPAGLPPILLACLLGIAASAYAWRANPWRIPLLLGLLVTAGLVATRWTWMGPIVAVLGGVALVGFALSAKERRWQAWSGTGPGVLLGLSLASSMTLSTVAVVGAGKWLVGAPAVPAVYTWFSGSFMVAGLVFVLVVVVAGAVMAVRLIKPSVLLDALQEEGAARNVRARHLAALAHRAEKVVGLLSAVSVLAVGLAVDATLSSRRDLPQWIVDYGLLATIAVGGAVVAAFAGARATRPLGLVWDLLCFLPRTAHPFAPPCYAERAVPELVERVREWLDEAPENRVVLSAHSLGAVLAAATVYALPSTERLSLITYGSQLRPYFGRIFPELLGPVVLGLPASRGGRLWSVDPWRWPHVNGAVNGGLSTMVPWTNLWRRTDFLGFPVQGYTTNDCDRAAAECNGSGHIQRHSDYQTSAEYQAALASHLE